jgi:hypothetical protein
MGGRIARPGQRFSSAFPHSPGRFNARETRDSGQGTKTLPLPHPHLFISVVLGPEGFLTSFGWPPVSFRY